MPVEIREYYIVVRSSSHVNEAWTPYDVTGEYLVDLEKLPKRAKYGTETLAAEAVAVAEAKTAAHIAHLSARLVPGDTQSTVFETLSIYKSMEFKVARVAITVDLL